MGTNSDSAFSTKSFTFFVYAPPNTPIDQEKVVNGLTRLIETGADRIVLTVRPESGITRIGTDLSERLSGGFNHDFLDGGPTTASIS